MLIKVIVAAILTALSPEGDVQKVPAPVRQELNLKGYCRMSVDDTSWIVCAERRGAKLRVRIEGS